MGRFYGKVGFVYTEQDPNDYTVWVEQTVERYYKGDLLSYNLKWSGGEGVNDNYTIGNRISIVADSFARCHYAHMRYVELDGIQWKINSVETEYPRLTLNLGGEYNGQT